MTEEQGNIYAKELERIMAETNKLAQQMRGKLKSMDAENKKLQGKNDSEYKLRTTQVRVAFKCFVHPRGAASDGSFNFTAFRSIEEIYGCHGKVQIYPTDVPRKVQAAVEAAILNRWVN